MEKVEAWRLKVFRWLVEKMEGVPWVSCPLDGGAELGLAGEEAELCRTEDDPVQAQGRGKG